MTHTLLQSVCICHISTHILTKRMTRQWRKQPTLPVYFNSHPHEEDDYFIFICPAPPFLFQLTSSRRGWLWCVEITLGCRHFNSHPHEEDDYTQALAELEKLISTHILTKRMTLRTLMLPILRVYFNSHPHEEDDGLCFPLGLLNWYFNSHPHEEDDLRNDGTANRSDISTHILTKRMTRTKPCRIPRH